MAEYLMGIDAGTGSVRVALFDFRGQNRAYAVAEYGTTYPKNGWAEQSDYEWFEALKKVLSVSRRLVSQQIISQRLLVMLQQTH
mgnify:FL=1